MTTIHVDTRWPETNSIGATFTMTGGIFTVDDLAAVRAATRCYAEMHGRTSVTTGNGLGVFDGRNPAKISLSWDARHGNLPAVTAFRTLKQRYSSTQFTTYGNELKRQIGDDIDQIRYTPSS